MVENIRDLFGKQARIGSVKDRAKARYSIHQFHVPVGVPCQRRHAITRLHAQPDQRTRQLAHAARDCRVVAIKHSFARQVGNHRNLGVRKLGMAQKADDIERACLHATRIADHIRHPFGEPRGFHRQGPRSWSPCRSRSSSRRRRGRCRSISSRRTGWQDGAHSRC